MKINTRLWIVAVTLGLITVVALNFYLRSMQQPAAVEQDEAVVVVAARTIPAHTRITADMLEVISLPAGSIHPDAIRNTADASGGITRSEIIQGEQVLPGRVVTDHNRGTLSYRIPENMRAITIPVNEVTGVAGYIVPGDKVDVLVTYRDEKIIDETVTFTIFQNITVLAVGDSVADKEIAEPQLVSTATLSVTPAQAEVLAFGFMTGSFHLALRSPIDGQIVELDFYSPANLDTFRER